MNRYYWSDTLEPVLGEGAEADEDIQQLGRQLGKLAEEGAAMTGVEMDGFVAGLAVMPDTVPAAAWLPEVWGPATAFGNMDEAADMEAALLAHHRGVQRTLDEDPERYGPLLEVDERDGGVIWKPWIMGFARAMRLRPAAWARIESSNDEDVQEALLVIQRLYDAANGTSELEPEGLEMLDELAPILIGGAVCNLKTARATGGEDGASRTVPHIGHPPSETAVRASPCACGSGRPFNRCCGSH